MSEYGVSGRCVKITKRGGVCNPAVYVLYEVTASDMAQNVSDGIQYPVRL